MGDSCWIFGHLAAGGAAGTVVYFIYFFPILIFIFILDGMGIYKRTYCSGYPATIVAETVKEYL